MGRDVIHFRCHHCRHCCSEVICLPTPWDVVRIVRDTGEDPYDFLEFLMRDEITGVERSDPTWLQCNAKRYIMALRRGKKGCHFFRWKTATCKIYESRPMICRLYPFCLHETPLGGFEQFSLHEDKDVECPRHRDGTVETKPLYALYCEDQVHQQAYANLVREFNRKKSKNKEPENFIAIFLEAEGLGEE